MPELFGVSHGALQFMAYEELKKGYSHYFSTPINKVSRKWLFTLIITQGTFKSKDVQLSALAETIDFRYHNWM